MSNPQQPEIARSRRSAVTEGAAKAKASARRPRTKQSPVGALPAENEPGHHPEVDQDKPQSPPTLPEPRERFRFVFDVPVALASVPFGVTPWTAYVEVTDADLTIRYGLWRLSTPLSNVRGAVTTGPYNWWKVAGPPHISFVDRGITFATSTREGLCIRFRRPVPAMLPRVKLQHPAATVTIEDPDRLVSRLRIARD